MADKDYDNRYEVQEDIKVESQRAVPRFPSAREIAEKAAAEYLYQSGERQAKAEIPDLQWTEKAKDITGSNPDPKYTDEMLRAQLEYVFARVMYITARHLGPKHPGYLDMDNLRIQMLKVR